MITDTQGLPLWDVFLAGDNTLPTGMNRGLDEYNKLFRFGVENYSFHSLVAAFIYKYQYRPWKTQISETLDAYMDKEALITKKWMSWITILVFDEKMNNDRLFNCQYL